MKKILYKTLKIIAWIAGIYICLCALVFVGDMCLYTFMGTTFEEMECAEDNICKEKLRFNIKGKEIIVTKESCLEYNGEWNEKIKTCHF